MIGGNIGGDTPAIQTGLVPDPIAPIQTGVAAALEGDKLAGDSNPSSTAIAHPAPAPRPRQRRSYRRRRATPRRERPIPVDAGLQSDDDDAAAVYNTDAAREQAARLKKEEEETAARWAKIEQDSLREQELLREQKEAA